MAPWANRSMFLTFGGSNNICKSNKYIFSEFTWKTSIVVNHVRQFCEFLNSIISTRYINVSCNIIKSMGFIHRHPHQSSFSMSWHCSTSVFSYSAFQSYLISLIQQSSLDSLTVSSATGKTCCAESVKTFLNFAYRFSRLLIT